MTIEYDEDDLPEEVAALQPSESGDVSKSIRGTIEKYSRKHADERQRSREAYVRELLRITEGAFAGERALDPAVALDELSQLLDDADTLPELYRPDASDLTEQQQLRLRRFLRERRQARAEDLDPSEVDLPLMQELAVYETAVMELGIIAHPSDKTRYAPVYFRPLDAPGTNQPGVIGPDDDEHPTPIGKVRVSKRSSRALEERAVAIPHDDCEHMLVIADPRQGKDSLIVRAAGNLKDEHGYKWISMYDDGRNETPVVACPTQQKPIKESLDDFGIAPKGYQTKVYVPALDLPGELPANHVAFSIGVDSLTTDVLANISGIDPDRSTEQRLKHAIKTAQDHGGSVDRLVELLQEYAGDTSAEVTVTSVDEKSGRTRSRTQVIEMGSDNDLEEVAETVLMLSSRGLIRDRGAETNLDMTEVIRDQDTVAVLNTNTLPKGDDALGYLLLLVWATLIWEARDEDPSLPRVAMELREIKELAPSKLGDVAYSGIMKSLRRMIKSISTNGGSRGIMMLGSTQKLRDLYDPVRKNMPIKVVLRVGPEKIAELESAGYSFDPDLQQEMRKFPTGWGMLDMPDKRETPIQWCGARCALGLKDIRFESQYGRGMGFRVLYWNPTPATWPHDAEVYVTADHHVRPAPCDREEWYLLPEDIVAGALVAGLDIPEALVETVTAERVYDALAQCPGVDAEVQLRTFASRYLRDGGEGAVATDGGEIETVAAVRNAVTDDLVDAALEARRAYDIQDLRPTSMLKSHSQRTLRLRATEEVEEEQRAEIQEDHDVSGPLKWWLDYERETVEKFERLLQCATDHSIESYDDWGAVSGVAPSTVGRWARDEQRLEQCVEKSDGEWELTPVGERALDIDWDEVFAYL